MSASIIHSNALKVKNTIEGAIVQVQSGQATLYSQESMIRSNLSQLQRHVSDLEDIVRREVTPIKRDAASAKASALKDDYNRLRTSFDSIKKAEEAKVAEEKRSALLGADPYGNQLSQRNPTNTQSTILMMDGLAHERDLLDNAGENIDRYINMGRQALQELYEQRSILKSTQKKLLDVANSLGLSSSVIRFIEQRTVADRYILYGGIVVCILAMWAIVHFFG